MQKVQEITFFPTTAVKEQKSRRSLPGPVAIYSGDAVGVPFVCVPSSGFKPVMTLPFIIPAGKLLLHVCISDLFMVNSYH